MYQINLKEIVPDLEARCKKLNTIRKVLMCLFFLIIPAIPAMIVLSKYGFCMQMCKAVNIVKMQDKTPITYVFGYASNGVEAAQKLIDTGNLKGYHIVADALIVKDGIEITEEEALREAAVYFSVPAAVARGMTADKMSRVAKMAIQMQQEQVQQQLQNSAPVDESTGNSKEVE